MEENTLYLNEERLGDLSVDQRITGEKETESIHMSRPLSSMYDFEYVMTALLTDSHYEHCLERGEMEWDEFDFDEMYR
ncbi:hypothetical protein ACK3SF_05045 [Candidatus Nanosalina sp. VS9-1]|uniref:hypothetical protein n=1 Tax=Candidatus Nanosalina sp. VS9-1 TaxID=3388566 RepID=UPI0039E159CE